jgi:hypothetical protein
MDLVHRDSYNCYTVFNSMTENGDLGMKNKNVAMV